MKIVQLMNPLMAPKTNCVRAPVPLTKRVAVALNWLATGNSYYSVGQVFGVSKPAVIKFTKIFIRAMYTIKNQYIKFPKSVAEIEKCIATFDGKTDLPHVVGSNDGTHIEIIKPMCPSCFDYWSRKQRYTIVNQAVCNGDLLHLSVDVGFPGSIHDKSMMEPTDIYRKAENGEILNSPHFQIRNIRITPYILGDPAYPALSWLTSPYAYGTRDVDQKRFNYELSRGRSCIERAFGFTQTRFRILMKKWSFHQRSQQRFLLFAVFYITF